MKIKINLKRTPHKMNERKSFPSSRLKFLDLAVLNEQNKCLNRHKNLLRIDSKIFEMRVMKITLLIYLSLHYINYTYHLKIFPQEFVEKKTSYFQSLCPLRHLFYSFRTTKSQSCRRFDGKHFPNHFVRGPLISPKMRSTRADWSTSYALPCLNFWISFIF